MHCGKCLWMGFLLDVLCQALAIYDDGCNGSVLKMTRGYFDSSYDKFMTKTVSLECAEECLQTPWCCSWSFSQSESECRLSSTCLFSPDGAGMHGDWSMFSRRNVLCYLNNVDPTANTGYLTKYNNAAELCETYGGTLASLEHLEQAWKKGVDKCGWGWLNDGTARLIAQSARAGFCGNGVGVMVQPSAPLRNKYNVWCHFTTGESLLKEPKGNCWPL